MNSKRLVLCMLFLLTALSLVAANAPVPAGFVARADGDIPVTRNGKKISVPVMELLYVSDVVEVAAGKSVRINLLPGTGYEIRGEASFRIADKPVFTRGKVAKQFEVDRKECAAAVEIIAETGGAGLSLSSGKGERSGVYRMRGAAKGKIVLLNTKILPSKAVLVWSAEKGTTAYAILIKDGEETVWSGVSERNYLLYPDTAPSLKGRENLVAVIRGTDVGKTTTGSGSGEFSLYDDETDAAFAEKEAGILAFGDELAMLLLSARLYESYGLVPFAVNQYEMAIRAGGDQRSIRAKIKSLNDEMDSAK